MSGEANGFSSRELGAWLMPMIMFGVWVFMRVLPRLDPLRENYKRFENTYLAIITIVLVFLGLLHVMVLGIALGWPISMGRVVPLMLGALFVALGLLLPRAQRNWFVGIRTPWTLSSDKVWERTHKLGGWLFVAAGLVLMLASFARPDALMPVLVATITIASGVPLIYSLVLYLNEKKSGNS